MSDNPALREQDGKLISLTQDHEVRYWCGAFGCTKDELQKAVIVAGNSAKAVRLYFQENPPKR